MNVKYSPESIGDLQRVVEFLENKNPFAARRIAIDLQEGVQKLKQFSQIGLPVLKASDPERIRDLYVGQYTVRYLITDEIIYILRIWHGKENDKNV
ncbi:type II toxin-antitoxin system RelE/ParE family toxin [Neptunicella marina]|uniref:Type II toxin-antitoxin system RelE/ParE family toxin n=1 Tax=Neptunicella marina TaxID=2125989 RepID=A0A8J6IUW2_9ALTE|nr:type II toxin-antitoxin system RelE/ParE family toxin [Neptunicella marina]MBC3767146.1 type II toxin-antitoxin system RelE/ParE family toxin [Neptunicella marina]